MKYVKFFEDFKNINENVTVDTSRYERSHGKKPRGKGSWAFYFDRIGGEAIFAPQSMDYTDAVKWAKEHAKESSKTTIYVGESLNELPIDENKNTIKKSELIQIIKEELKKALNKFK